MIINLKDKKQEILSLFTEEMLFEKFAGTSQGKVICPFHKDDTPSLSIRGKKFKCFGCNSGGDIFDFIMKMYNVNFSGALNIILSKEITKKHRFQEETIVEEKSELTFKVSDYQSKHFEYWNQYSIEKSTLIKYKVFPLKILLKGDYPLYVDYKDNLAFLYKFRRGYKVYIPLSKRFYSKGNCLQGINQINLSDKTLVITKSLKDVMFFSTIGINAISPASENTFISDSMMQYLISRFRVIINFDNDAPGIKASNYYKEKFGLPSIISPTKDFTDMVKSSGKLKTETEIKKQLKWLEQLK